MLSQFYNTRHRYHDIDNFAFTETNIATGRTFDCPDPTIYDNRQNAIVYAFLLASGALDSWVPKNGVYIPKALKKMHLNSFISTIRMRTNHSGAHAMRDLLNNQETMGTETTLVDTISKFFCYKIQGYRHPDLDEIFFEGDGLKQNLPTTYDYLDDGPHLNRRKEFVTMISTDGYHRAYLRALGDFWAPK